MNGLLCKSDTSILKHLWRRNALRRKPQITKVIQIFPHDRLFNTSLVTDLPIYQFTDSWESNSEGGVTYYY